MRGKILSPEAKKTTLKAYYLYINGHTRSQIKDLLNLTDGRYASYLNIAKRLLSPPSGIGQYQKTSKRVKNIKQQE